MATGDRGLAVIPNRIHNDALLGPQVFLADVLHPLGGKAQMLFLFELTEEGRELFRREPCDRTRCGREG